MRLVVMLLCLVGCGGLTAKVKRCESACYQYYMLGYARSCKIACDYKFRDNRNLKYLPTGYQDPDSFTPGTLQHSYSGARFPPPDSERWPGH